MTSLQKGECHDFQQVVFLGQFWGGSGPAQMPRSFLGIA